ncbi:MAG: WecB/TagA/CpsF family glycosyltransferase [Ignavibacteriaceae bacterium]|nr:WecB/TagA/CpsF family glycosyltransferase [Ignavibacteriaceae bacterium]
MANRFFNYNIYTAKLNEIKFRQNIIVATINPYSFIIAEKDLLFKDALVKSDILLPDGQGIVWAIKFLYNAKIKRIAGYDVFIYLMDELAKKEGKCFFFGSSTETLQKIKNKLKVDYPSVKMEYLSPPFKESFSDEENEKFVSLINKFNPDVLFVGMTAPKQEKWVYQNKDKINAKIIASIGAVFDFYAGTVKRPSKFWIDLGLEWFIRFLQEPKRLFMRNLYSIVFVIKILSAKLKNKY